MADKTFECPICKSEIPADSHECPRCGFKMAGVTQRFDLKDGQSTQAFSPVTAEAAAKATERIVEPALKVIKGPQADEVFYLDHSTVTLGRDPHCDIFLNDMTVSRYHAEIAINPGRVVLTDKGSLNGTWVDGKVCDEVELHEGSIIQIGTFVMMYQEHAEH